MIRKIRAHHCGPPACAHDLIAQRLGFIRGAVRLNGDRVSPLVQPDRNRAADATCRTSDQRGAWNLACHLNADASW
jgi:hypothetical protein